MKLEEEQKTEEDAKQAAIDAENMKEELEKQKIIIAEKIKIKMREAMWKKLKEE